MWNKDAGGYLSTFSSCTLRLSHFSLLFQSALQNPPAASGPVPTVCWVLFVGHACSLAGWVHVRILSHSTAGLGTTHGVCLYYLWLVAGWKSAVEPQCTVLKLFWICIMNVLLLDPQCRTFRCRTSLIGKCWSSKQHYTHCTTVGLNVNRDLCLHNN